MKTMRVLLASVAAASTAFFPLQAPAKSVNPRQPVVQLAVLLDTSSSMDGLIDQARTRLWQIVNDLATAKQHGVTPRLEVALYEYGNDGLARETNYIREVISFTADLDEISARLFALRTNGGSEYCGAVIEQAVERRYRRLLEESGETPDLILIDGGRGQVNAALAALDRLGVEQVPVVGLAKREEELYVPGVPEALRPSRHDAGLQLLQRVRDECHRFALARHRARRAVPLRHGRLPPPRPRLMAAALALLVYLPALAVALVLVWRRPVLASSGSVRPVGASRRPACASP